MWFGDKFASNKRNKVSFLGLGFGFLAAAYLVLGGGGERLLSYIANMNNKSSPKQEGHVGQPKESARTIAVKEDLAQLEAEQRELLARLGDKVSDCFVVTDASAPEALYWRPQEYASVSGRGIGDPTCFTAEKSGLFVNSSENGKRIRATVSLKRPGFPSRAFTLEVFIGEKEYKTPARAIRWGERTLSILDIGDPFGKGEHICNADPNDPVVKVMELNLFVAISRATLKCDNNPGTATRYGVTHVLCKTDAYDFAGNRKKGALLDADDVPVSLGEKNYRLSMPSPGGSSLSTHGLK